MHAEFCADGFEECRVEYGFDQPADVLSPEKSRTKSHSLVEESASAEPEEAHGHSHPMEDAHTHSRSKENVHSHSHAEKETPVEAQGHSHSVEDAHSHSHSKENVHSHSHAEKDAHSHPHSHGHGHAKGKMKKRSPSHGHAHGSGETWVAPETSGYDCRPLSNSIQVNNYLDKQNLEAFRNIRRKIHKARRRLPHSVSRGSNTYPFYTIRALLFRLFQWQHVL
jgi:hypothetical protein